VQVWKILDTKQPAAARILPIYLMLELQANAAVDIVLAKKKKKKLPQKSHQKKPKDFESPLSFKASVSVEANMSRD